MKKIFYLLLTFILCFSFISCSNSSSKSIKMEMIGVESRDKLRLCEDYPDILKGYIEFYDNSYEKGYFFTECSGSVVEGEFSGKYNKTFKVYEYSINVNGQPLKAACSVDTDSNMAIFSFAAKDIDMYFIFGT